MLKNKFNLFLLNLILFLLNSSATNESSEEKYDAVDSEYTLSEDTNFLEVL